MSERGCEAAVCATCRISDCFEPQTATSVEVKVNRTPRASARYLAARMPPAYARVVAPMTSADCRRGRERGAVCAWGTFTSSGFAVANATTAKSGKPTTAPQAVGHYRAAADALAIAAALRSRGGRARRAAWRDLWPGRNHRHRRRTGRASSQWSGPVSSLQGAVWGSIAMTRPDGRYVLASLGPGRYTLAHHSDCGAPGRYLDQWLGWRLLRPAAPRR